MYLAVVLLTMLVLPLASTVAELTVAGGAPLMVAGRWFVVWGIGARLLSAGVSQMVRPQFTAGMLGIEDPRAQIVVRELGFANTAMGVVGFLALPVPAFAVPGAVAGAIFLGLAGMGHVFNAERSRKEIIAMVSDLGLALLLALYLVVRTL
ncbi:hypothetical protein EZH22_17335 [Xanthobacter dioxanivorans]|uniref:Uncharacterized protein n=1 Tax=Xanthobacter dioxanivorans TaxID=2528964 RepID=A0A974PJU9_9HYPH|nr:DUF6790 family protein [Xanthobacter dioxanivorans]QRG04903.1 hypothetical protein EZH22_17335 [Xanthobacter dioxanivorans]